MCPVIYQKKNKQKMCPVICFMVYIKTKKVFDNCFMVKYWTTVPDNSGPERRMVPSCS